MICFLNELSLTNFPSKEEAIENLASFGRSYLLCRQKGVRDIKVISSFYSHQFAENCYFQNLIGDHLLDADLRALLASALGTHPSCDELLENYQTENGRIIEMSFDNTPCLGLGLASNAIHNTLSLSYDSLKWPDQKYQVDIKILEETEDGEIEERTIQAGVVNVSTEQHAIEHYEFFDHAVVSKIHSGRELWLNREELFPNLRFCDSVERQLRILNSSMLEFAQIQDRLLDLQKVASELNGTAMRADMFRNKVTPESESRIKALKDKLTFTCPDGESRLFSWHSRFTPNAGRIHFFPQEASAEIIIGHIGLKIQ